MYPQQVNPGRTTCPCVKAGMQCDERLSKLAKLLGNVGRGGNQPQQHMPTKDARVLTSHGKKKPTFENTKKYTINREENEAGQYDETERSAEQYEAWRTHRRR